VDCVEAVDFLSRRVDILSDYNTYPPRLAVATEKRSSGFRKVCEPVLGHHKAPQQIAVTAGILIGIRSHGSAHVEFRWWKETGVVDEAGEERAE
jgi:hypothetical protein